jgi:hypothetical protein
MPGLTPWQYLAVRQVPRHQHASKYSYTLAGFIATKTPLLGFRIARRARWARYRGAHDQVA